MEEAKMMMTGPKGPNALLPDDVICITHHARGYFQSLDHQQRINRRGGQGGNVTTPPLKPLNMTSLIKSRREVEEGCCNT